VSPLIALLGALAGAVLILASMHGVERSGDGWASVVRPWIAGRRRADEAHRLEPGTAIGEWENEGGSLAADFRSCARPNPPNRPALEASDTGSSMKPKAA
jgi:hypothetical protein